MNFKIDLKKTLTVAVIVTPLFLMIDILYDSLNNSLDFNLIFSTHNIFQKIASGFIAGIFFSASKKH